MSMLDTFDYVIIYGHSGLRMRANKKSRLAATAVNADLCPHLFAYIYSMCRA